MIDIDSFIGEVCGYQKQGAGYGYTKKLGKIKRHRVNRGGDRQGNNAFWTITNNRLIHHPETRRYAERHGPARARDSVPTHC